MASQVQLKVLFGKKKYIKNISRFYLERKKHQQSSVFFDVSFDVYTHVDNRERARAKD